MELQEFGTEKTFSSRYLVEQINLFRTQEGDRAELAHFTFLAKIEKEFEDEIGDKKILATSYTDSSNRQSKCYELNYEQSLQILMSESKTVRKAVIEVLKQQQELIKKTSAPQTYIQALEALLESEKKKEALALANENLNTVLDNLTNWVSIIKVCQHNGIKEKALNWRDLKKKSKILGYEIKKAESPRFGYQNLYHLDCFRACYPSLSYEFKTDNQLL